MYKLLLFFLYDTEHNPPYTNMHKMHNYLRRWEDKSFTQRYDSIYGWARNRGIVFKLAFDVETKECHFVFETEADVVECALLFGNDDHARTLTW